MKILPVFLVCAGIAFTSPVLADYQPPSIGYGVSDCTYRGSSRREECIKKPGINLSRLA